VEKKQQQLEQNYLGATVGTSEKCGNSKAKNKRRYLEINRKYTGEQYKTRYRRRSERINAREAELQSRETGTTRVGGEEKLAFYS